MEVNDLLEAIHEWRKKNKRNNPTMIKINPAYFHELMSDEYKNQYNNIELFEDENRIIGHKFRGIPLPITNEVETFEIV
ncbi:hypothetical protein [Metabacillus sp. Hm71]|uniref:hypothetical protein n=1 Tax=Metabacillus sp. Hm71 TaxID=3450743 RepID=UPI003F41CE2D